MDTAKETMLKLFTMFSLVTERTSGRKEEKGGRWSGRIT
jgi:hypothetical protein